MKKSLLVTSLFAVIALTACGENKPAGEPAGVVVAASDVVASAGAVASEVANLASDVVMQASEAVASVPAASAPEASK
jgi:uncharacterized lipoprotein YbaY